MASQACALPTPTSPSLRWPRLAPMVLLVTLTAVLFLFGLGDRDLNSSHEARAAQNAQTMLENGDWLLPHLYDGKAELQKPPLYYWLVAGIAYLRGGAVDVWAARLPAAGAALGCVFFLYLLGRRRGRPLAGLLGGLCLATCLHFTYLARVGRTDMPLTLAVTVALGSFELGRTAVSGRGRFAWCWLGYTALALGVLLKGPIALILVALPALAIWLARRSASVIPPPSLLWGVPWLLLLTVPWFVWIDVRTGGQLWDVFFWHHNLERGLGGSETLAVHPWWFYGARAVVDLLPWSVLVPAALWWQRRSGDRDGRAGLFWFASIFAFLTCMSFKRADYLLPAYPGLAIFFGCTGEDFWNRATAKVRTVALRLTVVLLAGYTLAWTGYNAWIVPQQEQGWPYRRMAREIRQHTQKPVIFFRAEAHLLAFHVGRPLDTILEWENLQVWAEREFPVYVVMPEDCAREWRQHLPAGSLEEVLRSADRIRGAHDRPLVVLRSRGRPAANR